MDETLSESATEGGGGGVGRHSNVWWRGSDGKKKLFLFFS